MNALLHLFYFIPFIIYIFIELDQFVEPLRATCTLKVKANAVKQEYEKQDELKRSALRALAALASIPKAGKFFDHGISNILFNILQNLYFRFARR